MMSTIDMSKETTARSAMKLALEALEIRCGTNAEERGPSGAIAALREALAEQPAQQEPVAKHYVDGGHLVYPPAQRTWVGLTDKEIRILWLEANDQDNSIIKHFARSIEAKLKEKQNGH